MKRKRYLNEIYMCEVTEPKITTKFNKELNAYITFKEIIGTTHTCRVFTNGRRIALVDLNYIMMEYSSIDENYNLRVFIDDKGNILQYYFDIILSSSSENGEIVYDDLYLDVIYETAFSTGCCNYIFLADESEIKEALEKGNITQEEYDFGYEKAIKLMDELKSGKNRFVNRGLQDYLEYKNKAV